MSAAGSFPCHPSNAPSPFAAAGRNYLSKPVGAASLSSSVWDLHLGGSRTSGARRGCWAEGTGDVASSPLPRSLPQSKERKKLFPVQKLGEIHPFLPALMPRGRQRSSTNRLEKDRKHLRAANSNDHLLPQLSLRVTLSALRMAPARGLWVKTNVLPHPTPLSFPIPPQPTTNISSSPAPQPCNPTPAIVPPSPRSIFDSAAAPWPCVCVCVRACVCTLTAHTLRYLLRVPFPRCPGLLRNSFHWQ